VEVASNAYRGKVVIETDDFFSFLNEANGLDPKEYKGFVKDLLKSGKPLIIKNAAVGPEGLSLNVGKLSINQFRIPKTDDTELKETLSKGCVATIAKYFLGNIAVVDTKAPSCSSFVERQEEKQLMIRKSLDAGSDAALIAQLFEWQISVRLDDLSGRLVIEK